jgi:hypothetical protein
VDECARVLPCVMSEWVGGVGGVSVVGVWLTGGKVVRGRVGVAVWLKD